LGDAVVMSVAADLADEITEKLERGRLDRDLIDTLAGAILRLFARLERHERRLATLERRLTPPPASPSIQAQKVTTERVSAAGDNQGQGKRGRGRPKGSRNRPPPVFIDIEYPVHLPGPSSE
jgi:hypothetical protein